jgi:lambda family phage minor tail protein L
MAEEGKNKVARSLLDLQPTALLELFRVYPDRINRPTVWLGFHGGAVYSESIFWQGFQYLPLSMESEGFDILGDGKLARPKIRVANKNNIITQLLQVHKDFKNASFVRKRVSVKFIDDENFEGGNPFGEADPKAELTNETWLMGRKTQESRLFVEFELNSPLDLESSSVNPRSIVSKFCPWQYRGEGCRYQGLPIERSDGENFQDLDGSGVAPNYSPQNGSAASFLNDPSIIWDELKPYSKGAVVTTESPTIFLPNDPNTQGEPLKTAYISVHDNNIGQSPEGNPSFWQRDGCTKKLSACKKRFNKIDLVGFLEGQNIDSGFNAIQISGQASDDNTLIPTNTGLFHTTAPELMSQLTGEFTIMGWVNITVNSPVGAGILSTSPRDDEHWPNTQWLNINAVTNPIPYERNARKNRADGTTKIAAHYMGYVINPSTHAWNYNAYRRVDLHQQQAGGDSREWVQYIITNSIEDPSINGEGGDANTLIKFYVNGLDQSTNTTQWYGNDAGHKLNTNIGNFASLAQREAVDWSYYPNEKPLPQTFMLGAVEYYGGRIGYRHPTVTPYTTSMNGALGPWALWNRPLNDEEINYLYKRIPTPNSVSNPLDFAPRNYNECTGRFGTITGSGGGSLSYGADSLVAWWDASTGFIPTTTDIGMLDIHTGGIHLTGSGEFAGILQDYKEAPLTLLQNPTPTFPNFGGFPGTDGFSYARNTQV